MIYLVTWLQGGKTDITEELESEEKALFVVNELMSSKLVDIASIEIYRAEKLKLKISLEP